MSSLEYVDGCTELGFIGETPLWKLNSIFFPSKIGGFPAWLALENIPKGNAAACPKCHKPMVFLCQIYAPFNDKEDCFHRTLFVLICRDENCSSDNDATNIRIYRNQLNRENKYYSYEPYKETEKDCKSPGAADFQSLCRVCGFPGAKVCGGCKLANYCSKEHQARDWKAGHKSECINKELLPVSPGSRNLLFPEFEIDLEPEEMEAKEEKTVEQVMKEYDELLRGGKADKSVGEYPEDDLATSAVKETDKQFQRFRTRIKDYPNQIIRYDRNGEPLWVSAVNKPFVIPPCELCGGPRQFEFQIMPQLLVYLRADSTGKSIDWGTILVYSCAQSCQSDSNYVKEVAFKQDYSPISDIMRKKT